MEAGEVPPPLNALYVLKPHRQQSHTCHHAWSLTTHQPQHALHSASCIGTILSLHPFHTSHVSRLLWTIIIASVASASPLYPTYLHDSLSKMQI